MGARRFLDLQALGVIRGNTDLATSGYAPRLGTARAESWWMNRLPPGVADWFSSSVRYFLLDMVQALSPNYRWSDNCVARDSGRNGELSMHVCSLFYFLYRVIFKVLYPVSHAPV